MPPGQAPRSAVALAVDPAGTGLAFYRGADKAVYMRTFRGTDNALWGNGLGGGGSAGWRKIGGKLIDGPTAAGTRQPTPHMIVAVIGTDHAVWTAMYPTSNGWSGFTRAWVPRG